MNINIIKDVEQILREIDPMDLISGGAPEDEYDDEAGRIASKLLEKPSKDDLLIFIKRFFEERFGLDFSQEKLEVLCSRLNQIHL